MWSSLRTDRARVEQRALHSHGPGEVVFVKPTAHPYRMGVSATQAATAAITEGMRSFVVSEATVRNKEHYLKKSEQNFYINSNICLVCSASYLS